jgi:Flp pilus assembly protein CpaB
MNKKQMGSILIGVGVLVALIAGGGVWYTVKSTEDKLAQTPTRRVVVATQDIPEQGKVEARMVTLASISEESLPARPITTLDAAIGKFARGRIYKGDILNQDRVVDLATIRQDVSQGRPAPAPSLVLDNNQVMFVLPARMTGNFWGQGPNLLTATDAIRAGDYVDILVTTLDFPDSITPEQRTQIKGTDAAADYMRTRVLFQNLRVHNVGAFAGPDQKDQSGAKSEERYLTFVVDRETALQLKWLKDVVAQGSASVDFVLRSPGNAEELPTQSVSFQEMRQRYGLGARQ